MQANQQRRRPALPVLAVALTALLLAPPAPAQDAPKKAPSKTTPTSKANLMTRDELRACMNEQDRLKQVRAKVDQEQAALDQQKAKVQAMDAELQKKIAALDAADEATRAGLMDEGAKRDQAADDYNARLATLRQQGQAFDSDRAAWVERCTKRDFDEMDEAAIKKERQQAAAKKK